MKEARFEYFVKKQKELRLYLYDKGLEWLKLIGSEIKDDYDPFLYKYDINRQNTEKTYIDRAYLEPAESCFVIGKIEKTIATHGVYIDYIQPIYEIPFDFEYKEEIPGGEFNYKVLDLANRILTLLLFAIQKEYKKDYYTKKIREYNNEVTIDDAICSFKNEVQEALKQRNVKRLRKLSMLLEEPSEEELKLEKYN